jgi:hypothetical protein
MVTTLSEFAGLIYDVAYCARGQSENLIRMALGHEVVAIRSRRPYASERR